MSFTRLSLIDPAGGRQPFVSADGNVILAANGEIYNYRELRTEFGENSFRSQSDCEVLLALYLRDGLAFLDRVRGMFGIAVIDLREQRLVLARDRIGLKPLFFHRSGADIVFGSEVKALFAHPLVPRVLDWHSALADQGLNAAPVIPEEGFSGWFTGVDQVEPGTILTVSLRDGRTKERRYWSLPAPAAVGDTSPAELVGRLRELLESSVEECLIADAEIGIMLSGGVDSAGIAALTRGRAPHSYSALTASTLLNGDTDSARLTAKALGLVHHEIALNVNNPPTVSEWLRLLWLMESPLCGPEQYFKSEIYRAARISRPGLKAMLLGSGADELSGGYTRLLSGGGDWHSFIANVTDMSRRAALSRHSPTLGVWWQGQRRLVSDDLIRHSYPGALDDVYDDFVTWKVRDWQQYNFWVEDRTASGNAVEARVPYLDHRIIELLSAVPREFRQELFWDKRIIRSALADILPEEITSRPKIAFYEGVGVRHTHLTFAKMLAQDNAHLLERALAVPSAAQFLDADNMRAALRDVLDGRGDTHIELLLRLVNLALLDEMLVDPPQTRGSDAPAPLELTADSDRKAQVEATFYEDGVLDPEQTLVFAEGVLLLDGPDGRSYIAVDGELRFEIDHETDLGWLQFLRSLDGKSSITAAAVAASVEIDEVAEFISQSINLGLLVDSRVRQVDSALSMTG